jgi:hypothetical protein
MTTGGYREEVFNVLLALLLHQRGVVTAPEQAFKQDIDSRRRIPDVLVVFQGLRTVIEGKVDDRPDAREEALQQAQERVNKGIAHIGMAVIYPRTLRRTPFPDLTDALSQSQFSIATFSEAGETGWTEGDLDYLAEVLRRTFDQLIQEDVVAKAVESLSGGVREFARSAFASPATAQRAAQILGISEPPRRRRRRAEDEDE